MSQKEKLLSTVTPWDLVAPGYAEVTMKYFQFYADHAVSLVRLREQSQILDVACGPGTLTLTAAPTVKSVQSLDFSKSMLEILAQKIEETNVQNVELTCRDGQSLPYEDNSFDAGFSLFGLMFFPDPLKGLKEIYRTLKPGGKVVISSWAPLSQSPVMQAMFGAFRAMNPNMPDPSTDLESLENPEFFQKQLEAAGFKQVEVKPVTQGHPLESVEKFWDDMVKGSAPLVMMKHRLPAQEWEDKNQIALDYLRKYFATANLNLSATAWFGVGQK